jgi:hypothetical protein
MRPKDVQRAANRAATENSTSIAVALGRGYHRVGTLTNGVGIELIVFVKRFKSDAAPIE